jgi:MYXO-CTERM domain-containing protein
MSRVSFCAVVAAVSAFAGTAVSADAAISITGLIPASSEQTGSSFSGVIDYSGAGTLGTLTISLTNTTAPSIGGFLTAFVFNINSVDPAASALQTSGPNANWSGMSAPSGNPFGIFDAGSSTGGSFEGGGPPSRGLAPGASGTWVFSVSASDAGALTPSSFMTGPNQYDFVVRFRGLTNGGSDKVPAIEAPPPVPTPGALALAGLTGGAVARRRRR